MNISMSDVIKYFVVSNVIVVLIFLKRVVSGKINNKFNKFVVIKILLNFFL